MTSTQGLSTPGQPDWEAHDHEVSDRLRPLCPIWSRCLSARRKRCAHAHRRWRGHGLRRGRYRLPHELFVVVLVHRNAEPPASPLADLLADLDFSAEADDRGPYPELDKFVHGRLYGRWAVRVGCGDG